MKKPFPPSSGVVPKFAPRQREVQYASAGPAGWFATVKDQLANLRKDIAGLNLSMQRSKEQCVPAALVGSRLFLPETNSTVSLPQTPAPGTVVANYVVRDGQDYAISIQNTYPGVFIAYTMKVKMSFRAFLPASVTGNNAQVMNVPIFPNYVGSTKYINGVRPARRYGLAAATKDPSDVTYAQLQNVMSYFWNLTDEKSSRKFSDTMVPDMVLLPSIQPNSGTDIMPDATPSGLPLPISPVDGDNFQFEVPWQIERDGQLTFTFRAINPFFQVYSGDAYLPFINYNDLENGTRNNSVTIQVELHGMRVLQQQDADREGAHVDGSRGYVP